MAEFDRDALYEKQVKANYSAVIAYISDTTFSRHDDQTSSLQWLREANTYIVVAVKDVKRLRLYVQSANQSISAANGKICTHVSMNQVLAAQALFGVADRELLNVAKTLFLDDAERAGIREVV